MERLQATRIYPEIFKHLVQNMLETTFWTSCLKRCKMIEIARHTHTTQTLLTQATHRLACKQRKQNHVSTTRLAALQDPQAACSSHPALEAKPLQTRRKEWQTCGTMQHGQSGKTGSSEVVTLKKFRSCTQSNLVGKPESETRNAINACDKRIGKSRPQTSSADAQSLQ